MTVENERGNLAAAMTVGETAAIHPGWRTALPALVAVLIGVVLLFAGTARSLVGVWANSETYAHGFLVLPISGYLVWRSRRQIAALAPRPEPLGLVLVAGAALLWLIGRFAAVQVLEHLALALMLQATVLTLLGRRVTRALVFPLAYLLFAVPMGQGLVPSLQNFTADFSVSALRWAGVPVFHDGNYIATPTGNFLVAKACSGVRYLIASLALGVLFAGITYRNWPRRLVFVALSLIVPIFANGVRAFGIIYLAYVSNNGLALGVDHILYGWLFFALVMFLLLAIGMRFAQDAVADETPVVDPAPPSHGWPAFTAVGALALMVAGAAPAFAAYAAGRDAAPTVAIAPPTPASPWRAVAAEPAWRPDFPGASLVLSQVYARDGVDAELHVVYFARQGPGAELVNSENSLAGVGWQPAGTGSRRVNFAGRERDVSVVRYAHQGRRRTAWFWYWENGTVTADPYVAKWLEIRGKLTGTSPAAAMVGVVTDESGSDDPADVLESLLASLPAMDNLVARIAGAAD